MCSSRSRNCRGIELSSRDFKTIAISVTRGLKTVEHIEHIEQGLENCQAYRAGTWKLSRYRTIEQGLENCRAYRAGTWKLSSISSRDLIENCRSYRAGTWKLSSISSILSRDLKTVEVSNYRAGTSKLSQYLSLEQSYTVLTHGLHVRALALRHSPPAGDLASAYPPKPLLFTLLGVGAWYDLQSLWAKLHRIWAWFEPPSPAFEAHPPEGNFSIRVSSQTPTFWNGSPSHAACLTALRCITVAWRKVADWLEGRCAHTESFRLISVKVSCNNFGQSYSVFRHGLHLRTLCLMHSPLQAT